MREGEEEDYSTWPDQQSQRPCTGAKCDRWTNSSPLSTEQSTWHAGITTTKRQSSLN